MVEDASGQRKKLQLLTSETDEMYNLFVSMTLFYNSSYFEMRLQHIV